jgi:intracellular multiplication protein IcmO
MPAPNFGLDSTREIRPDRLLIDARPFWVKVADGLHDPTTTFVILLGGCGLCVISPVAALFIPWVGLLYFLFFLTPNNVGGRADTSKFLPLRAPIQEHLVEFKNIGDPYSGTRKPSGIFEIGYEIATDREMWISNQEAREHMWITGTTGSGKTEFLMSIMMNCLSWGSGFIMIDGKGDIATAIKVWRMLRLVGRIDDFLLLNFMTGGRYSAAGGLLGHSSNPFSFYSQPEIMQVIDTMLPTPSGDGAMWQGRAVAMLSGVVKVLVWLRDAKGKEMSVIDIRESMGLDNMMRMAVPDEVAMPLYKGMPTEVKSGVLGYLRNLAGFPNELLVMPSSPQQEHPLAKDPMAIQKFADQTRTQHGFLTQQLSMPFNTLAENYRTIFGARSGDVDMFDVVLNRRCLVVVLPGLQKSLDEMANLGKIVVATLKTVMGDALGSQIEGSLDRILDRRMTNAPSPIMVIMDEVTYYIAKGLAMFPAQGRGLGFGFVFAVQSLTALFKREDVEGRDAFGTTNTRITMFVVDENETIESARKSGGEGVAAQQSGFEADHGSLLPGQHRGVVNSGINKMDRVSGRDVRRQATGEFIYNRGDLVIKSRSMYIQDDSLTNPGIRTKLDSFDSIRLTHFVSIPQESEEDIAEKAAFEKFCALLTGNHEILAQLKGNAIRDDISEMKDVMSLLGEAGASELEKSCVAFAAIASQLVSAVAYTNSGAVPAHPGAMPDFLSNANNKALRGAAKAVPSRLPATRRAAQRAMDGADRDLDLSLGGAVGVPDSVIRAMEQMDNAEGHTAEELDAAISQAIATGAADPVVDPLDPAGDIAPVQINRRFGNRTAPPPVSPTTEAPISTEAADLKNSAAAMGITPIPSTTEAIPPSETPVAPAVPNAPPAAATPKAAPVAPVVPEKMANSVADYLSGIMGEGGAGLFGEDN